MLAPSTSPTDANGHRRRRAVELRLSGHSLAAIRAETGLSVPTIVAAHKAFVAGGWAAVAARRRGQAPGAGRAMTGDQDATLKRVLTSESPDEAPLWSVPAARAWLQRWHGLDPAERTLQRTLARWGFALPTLRESAARSAEGAAWVAESLPAIVQRAHAERATLLWLADFALPGQPGRLLVAQTLRGAPAWLPVRTVHDARAHVDFMQRVRRQWPGPLVVLLHGVSPAAQPLASWIAAQPGLQVEPCPVGLPRRGGVAMNVAQSVSAHAATRAPLPPTTPPSLTPSPAMKLTHLQRLEAESIHILREVVATCERPVMLYSVGKDSACMLHLARKAFWPAPPPFPLLHVDTTWKFREMYELRDRMAREMGMELIVWRNPEAERLGINPFDHGSQIHTDLWKTQGLKQALDHHGFDAAFGGARRDEEKSRAKERIFSFRDARHHWDPKQQRPELWHLYNTRKLKGESIRVFPLSNWTELDVWQYIHREHIPVVPLYLARERPVVERDGTLIMVDDDRMPLRPGELPVMRRVRFRTLGCYPLSGAIESDADTLGAVIAEMLAARTSERQGRLIDHDQTASMERKKQEGYF